MSQSGNDVEILQEMGFPRNRAYETFFDIPLSAWAIIEDFCVKFCSLAVPGRGSSSVLFAYSFLLLFGQFDNIYKVEQNSLYFFS